MHIKTVTLGLENKFAMVSKALEPKPLHMSFCALHSLVHRKERLSITENGFLCCLKQMPYIQIIQHTACSAYYLFWCKQTPFMFLGYIVSFWDAWLTERKNKTLSHENSLVCKCMILLGIVCFKRNCIKRVQIYPDVQVNITAFFSIV